MIQTVLIARILADVVRPPWSSRRNPEAAEAFFVLREGVPDGLLTSLWGFVRDNLYVEHSTPMRYALIPNPEYSDRFARVHDRYLPNDPDTAFKEFQKDRYFLLDAVDFILGLVNQDRRRTALIFNLEVALLEARSAYSVGVDGAGKLQLQNRQPEELTRLVSDVASDTTRAAEHLRRAWSKAFARNPDPNGACIEAVQAIEVAARPVISPANTRATLGTLIRDLKAKPDKWHTDSDSNEAILRIISMMELVWTGHYRHGDPTKQIDVSAPGAEMIVDLAVVLVHWFQSGRIRLLGKSLQ